MDSLIESCEAMPFLAEQKCVVVIPLILRDLSASDKEKITALLEDPVPTTVLILIVDKEEFLPKKSCRCKKLVHCATKLALCWN